MSKFTEFRKDGWPLCPRCGEDELYSLVILDWNDAKAPKPTMEACLAGEFRCYGCSYDSEKIKR